MKAKGVRLVLVGATLVLCFAFPASTSGAGLTRAQARTIQARTAVREAATERSVPVGKYPMLSPDRQWRLVGPSGWAGGYAAAILWLEYQTGGQGWWRHHALSREAAIGRQRLTPDSLNLGPRFYPTFARGYILTGSGSLKTIGVRAAQCLAARSSPTVGALRSRPEPGFNVIIDSLMNLPLLFWAADRGGPSEWAQIARQHALTIARDFIRPDGSTYHMVIYDEATGAVEQKTSTDGYGPESMWARGQAWAIWGFAACYRESGDAAFLEAAHRVADRYLADLPADLVPYWDFRDPDIPAAPRDSSAAAIAASGLLDLAVTDPDPELRSTYASAAREILAALSAPPYVSLRANPALLLRATVNYRKGQTRVGAAYGDYFYLQALLRLRLLPPNTAALRVVRVRASTGDASLAVDGSTGTAWSSIGRQSLDLRLAAPGPVKGVRLALLDGDRRAANLRIFVSLDGWHWTLVKRTMSSGDTSGFEFYDFARRSARWIRIECSGTSTGRRNEVAEAQIY
jgi:unsaturated chondroitin disaccharide hydrolase